LIHLVQIAVGHFPTEGYAVCYTRQPQAQAVQCTLTTATDWLAYHSSVIWLPSTATPLLEECHKGCRHTTYSEIFS